MTPDVTKVVAVDDHGLIVTLADGATRRFSMRPFLQSPAYRALNAPGKFRRAHSANGTVVWSDEIDISPDTLYLGNKTETEQA